MEIVYKRTEELNPYKNNPRKNDEAVEMVAESIKRFGFKVPITIDKNNVVVTGHTRLKAAIQLAMHEVPCIVLDDLTDDEVKAFRLVDNRTSEIAEWDYNALALELDEIQMDMTAFEIEMPKTENEVEEDNYEIIVPEEPKSQRGQIYRLGEHRLMCGDATDENDVAILMDGNQADCLQTDPPYNVDYGSKAEAINRYGYHFSDRHIENDYMPSDQFIDFLGRAFQNANKAMKPGASFYIWHASVTIFEFEYALRINSMKSRQQIIWNKNSIVLGRQDYQWKHEPCLYGWKEGAAHYFIDSRRNTTVIEDSAPKYKAMKKDELIKLLDEIYADKVSTSVMNEDKPSRSDEHPTMKPLKLLARQIANSTQKGDIVLDLFGGSGSTMMTCEQLERKCYMMELDPKYVDTIIDRFERLTGKKAVLEQEEQHEIV